MLSLFSHVQFFATLWTISHQAPLSVGFSRQAYWSGVPFSSPGDLPYPGIEPASPVSPALKVGFLPSEPSGKPSSILSYSPRIQWARCKGFRVIFGSGFPAGASGKEPAGDTRDASLIPESGRSLGGGHGNPLQYSRLENPMNRGA